MSEIFTNSMTIAVISIFIAIHLLARELYSQLFRSVRIAMSFSGGLAIAYVFFHLLPELNKGDLYLGQLPSHLLCLFGFLMFYGIQRLVWRSAHHWELPYQQLIFWLQITFSCIYNFLLIYTIPEASTQNILSAILYIISIGLHLLANSNAHYEKHPRLFHHYGRYLLIGALIVGGAVKLGLGHENELLATSLMALLAGFLMFNIFARELPHQQETHYGWFVFGAALYVGLMTSAIYLGAPTSGEQAIEHWLNYG